MQRREFLKTSAAAAGTFTALPAFAQKRAGGANILFIMCDQWRKHSLGFMNQDRVLTPCLDALAKNSAVMLNAYSTVPVCGPNRACLFSGKYSMNTGLLGNDAALLPEHQTFGEISKAAGYQTAYIGKWHLGDVLKTSGDTEKGYVPPAQRHGFDYWMKSENHQPFRQPWFVQNEKKRSYPGGEWEPDYIEELASSFVKRRDKNRPFAMALSFAPPHTGGGPGFEDRFNPAKITGKMTSEKLKGYGYAAPADFEAPYVPGGECYHRPVRENCQPIPEYEESKCVQGYFGAITAIDEAIGRLIETLRNENVLDNTVIVITADHGELMGSHGRMTKGNWFQESAGIPMIIHYPAAVKPAQYDCVFNSIDVLPTILGLTGLSSPGNLDGTDYTPLLTGGKQNVPEYAFGAYFRGGAPDYETGKGWRLFRTVYTKRYTYVLSHGGYVEQAGAKEVIYDRETDPYELAPVRRGQDMDAVMDQLKGVLEKHLAEINDPFMTEVWPKEYGNVDWTPYRNLVEKTYFPEG